MKSRQLNTAFPPSEDVTSLVHKFNRSCVTKDTQAGGEAVGTDRLYDRQMKRTRLRGQDMC